MAMGRCIGGGLVAALLATGCGRSAATSQSDESLGQARQAAVASRTLIGYWHNFDNRNPTLTSGAAPIKLSTLVSNTNWDVVVVAFGTDAGGGAVGFSPLDKDLTGAAFYTSDAAFITDVDAVKSSGKKVILSLGGQNGSVSLPDAASTTNFTNSLCNSSGTGLLQKYHFDGIDLDLETGVSQGLPIVANLVTGIKNVKTCFGSTFYLSMAPEIPYVQGAWFTYGGISGAYLPIIGNHAGEGLRDILNVLHVQLYNDDPPSTPYSSSNLPRASIDAAVGSTLMLLQGFSYPFTTNANHFDALAQSQVAFGVPSGPSSANAGYMMSPSNVTSAFDCLTKGTNCGPLIKPGGNDINGNAYWPTGSNYPNLRGVMTWSITWDVHDSYNFSVPVGSYLHAAQTGDTTAPTVPGTPTTSNVTSASVTLNWSASSDNVGVTGYKIFRGSTQIGTSATTSFIDNTVGANTAYSYTVSAYDAAGNNSGQSGAVNVTTATSSDTSAPSTPAGLASSGATSTSVPLTWTASTDNVAVTGYKIFRGSSAANATQIGTSTSNAYTDGTAVASTTYVYLVSAYDAAGNNSGQSSSLSVTTPAAPTGCNPTITSLGSAKCNSTFTYTNNKMYKCISQAAGVNGEPSGCGTTGVYCSSIAPDNGAWGTTAWAYVQDCNGTSSDTTPPSVPANLANGTVTSSSVPLTWSASTDNVGVTGYKIFRGGSQIATSAGTSYTDNSVTASSTYSYQVAAVDGAGNTSGMSTALSVSTPAPPSDTQAPTVPTNLAAGTITASSVALSWTASTDNVGIAGYKVYRGTTVIATTTGTATTYTDTTAAPATTYQYKVAAYDAAGNVSAATSPITVTTASASSTCAQAYNAANWPSYGVGTQVSFNGHNWTCNNINCQLCAPASTGCGWGDGRWTDNGTCK
jgi:chitinase/chitodextrinase